MPEDFTNNDYETPDRVASAMAALILPTDRRILEPCAGTGQIIKAIAESNLSKPLWHSGWGLTTTMYQDCTFLDANEIKHERYRKLCRRFGGLSQKFNNIDFLGWDEETKYDLIITNPPFEFALDFIGRAVTLLNDKLESRLLFLMPIDTLSSQGRAKQFKALDCHVSRLHIIPGRIDYLKDGVPMSKCQKIKNGIPQFSKDGKPIFNSGRQVSDAVFEIKKGKGNVFNFLEV